MELKYHQIDSTVDDTFYEVEGMDGLTVRDAIDVILERDTWGRIRMACSDFQMANGLPNYRLLCDYRDHHEEGIDLNIWGTMTIRNEESYMARRVERVIADSTWGNRTDYTLHISSAYEGCAEHYY